MSPNILIVEDELDLMSLFQIIIQRYNPTARIQTAHGGKAALVYLQDHVPDLITIDLAMPQVSGNDVIHYLIAEPRLDRTAVLVVTAVPTRLDSISRQRISAMLTKPVAPLELEQTISRLLNGIPSQN